MDARRPKRSNPNDCWRDRRSMVETTDAGDGPLVDTHAHAYTLDMPLSPTAWHRPAHDAPIENYIKAARYARHHPCGAGRRQHLWRLQRLPDRRTSKISAPARHGDPQQSGDRSLHPGDDEGRRRGRRPLPAAQRRELRPTCRRRNTSCCCAASPISAGMRIFWKTTASASSSRSPILKPSGVKLVIDHFGRPDPAKGVNCEGFKAVLRSVEKGNTWVKLSASYRLASREHGQGARRRTPEDRRTRAPVLGQRLAVRSLRGSGHLRRHGARLLRLDPRSRCAAEDRRRDARSSSTSAESHRGTHLVIACISRCPAAPIPLTTGEVVDVPQNARAKET